MHRRRNIFGQQHFAFRFLSGLFYQIGIGKVSTDFPSRRHPRRRLSAFGFMTA